MERGLITNAIGVVAVLAVAYASQWVGFGHVSKDFVSRPPSFKKEIPYISQAGDWLKSNVYDRIARGSGEVAGQAEAFQDAVQEEIVEQKNNLQEKSVSATKKFIAEKILGILGVSPQDLQPQAEPEASCNCSQ